MGVDIGFYKVKKNMLQETLQQCGGDPDSGNFDWTKFHDTIKENELTYYCGRHLMWKEILEFSGDMLKIPTIQELRSLLEKCRNYISKYAIYYEEVLTIPITVLEKYIEQAKQEESPLVTIPLEDRRDDEYCLDDTDYYQARSYVEDVGPAIESLADDEMIVVEYSY